MRILVLGGGGQLGSALCKRLGEVAAPSRKVLDLNDLDAVRACLRSVSPDLVINCAAYNAVDRAESEPDVAMRINRDVPALLGELAPALITFSTDYVFDGALDRPYSEADATNPLSCYGRSKLAGEHALLALDAPAIIFRTAWVWTLTHPSFVSTMVKLGNEREVLRVVDDQIGNPTFAPDLADAVLKVVNDGDFRNKRGLYHLAGETAVSRYDLAKHVVRGARVDPVPSSAYPAPAERPKKVVLDCTRARETFGVSIPGYVDAFARAQRGSS